MKDWCPETAPTTVADSDGDEEVAELLDEVSDEASGVGVVVGVAVAVSVGEGVLVGVDVSESDADEDEVEDVEVCVAVSKLCDGEDVGVVEGVVGDVVNDISVSVVVGAEGSDGLGRRLVKLLNGMPSSPASCPKEPASSVVGRTKGKGVSALAAPLSSNESRKLPTWGSPRGACLAMSPCTWLSVSISSQ